MEFNRRTYLKTAAAGALGTVGATGFVLEARANQSIPESMQQPCPKGSTFVAKYEPASGEIFFIDGTDVVRFPTITTNADGKVTGFEWAIKDAYRPGYPISVVTVRAAGAFSEFEGVFSGQVDVGDPIDYIVFCETNDGRAAIGNRDLSNTYNVEMHFDGDPASGTRTDPVHVTSDGTATSDYATSMVKVLDRIGQFTLGDLTTLQYDYFEASSNEGAAPDEMFIGLLETGGTSSDDTVRGAATHLDQGDSATWRTADVLALVDEPRWNVREITYSDLTSGFVHEEGEKLRDTTQSNVTLTDEPYVSSTVLHVGFGAGSTRTEVAGDRYFDNLTVDGTTVGFPAMIPMTVDFQGQGDGDNTITAVINFQQTEIGLALTDVEQSSIELNAFQEIATPVERGLIPENVELTTAGLEADFQESIVDSILTDENVNQAIVSGDFAPTAGTAGSAFFGVGVPFQQ